MDEKYRTWIVNLFFSAVLFGAGFFLRGQFNGDSNTTTQWKTHYVYIPGYTDTTQKPVQDSKPAPLKKDSSDYWKAKYDSIQSLTQKSDTSKSADSVRAEYFHPYQITVEDSLTTNWVTVFPLNPMGTRARIDSTRYKPVELSYTYLDTTVNVTRNNPFRTYGVVAAGAGIGALAGGPIGAAVGAPAALLFDMIFF